MFEPDVIAFKDEQEAGEILGQLAKEILAGRKAHIVLDFFLVKSLSSATIAKLIKINQVARLHSGRLVLCSLCNQIKDVLNMTHLTPLFSITPDSEEARKLFTRRGLT